MSIPSPKLLTRSVPLLLALAALVLAVHPVQWLVNSWVDPAYASFGGYVWVLVAALFVWSASSERTRRAPAGDRPLWVLAGTAVIRLIGRLGAVDVVGALALVLDVYALAWLADTGGRRRALSPGWLAASFVFALPLERLLQRTMGFSLQLLSASGACTLLKAGLGPVECVGTRLILAGRDLMVDLPCSGARELLQLLLLFCLLAAWVRPSWPRAAIGLVLAVVSGLVANTVRITALAVGVAHPEGIDVMAAPWHEAIGLVTLALGALPILLWAKNRCHATDSHFPAISRRDRNENRSHGTYFSVALLVIACVVVSVPGRPLDVAAASPAPALPSSLLDDAGRVQPLSDKERDYFTAFGGGAAKATYGEHGLLLVTTTSPLRHLHAPDECLRGLGHDVTRVGLAFDGPLASAIYRSAAPSGDVYRIAVTYVDDRGAVATSVAEVVWRWLADPERRWTAIERISPWQAPPPAAREFDAAVARALELPNLPLRLEDHRS